MKLVIDSDYFGDSDSMIRFLKNTLQEIERIEKAGMKNSKEPHRFLSDCYPALSQIQCMFGTALENHTRQNELMSLSISEVAK